MGETYIDVGGIFIAFNRQCGYNLTRKLINFQNGPIFFKHFVGNMKIKENIKVLINLPILQEATIYETDGLTITDLFKIKRISYDVFIHEDLYTTRRDHIIDFLLED